MNERLQEVLADTLEKATAVGGEVYDATKKGLGKAVDFAQEQIPDVIAQLMKWEFAYHALWAGVWLLSITLLLVYVRRVWKTTKDLDKDVPHYAICSERFAWRIPAYVAMLVSTLIFFNGFVNNAGQCMKIGFAPKVFLLEYCSDLVHVRQHNAKLAPNDQTRISVKHNH